jgi:hypothetical protein
MPVRILHKRTGGPLGELLLGVGLSLASGGTRNRKYHRRKAFPVGQRSKARNTLYRGQLVARTFADRVTTLSGYPEAACRSKPVRHNNLPEEKEYCVTDTKYQLHDSTRKSSLQRKHKIYILTPR